MRWEGHACFSGRVFFVVSRGSGKRLKKKIRRQSLKGEEGRGKNRNSESLVSWLRTERKHRRERLEEKKKEQKKKRHYRKLNTSPIPSSTNSNHPSASPVVRKGGIKKDLRRGVRTVGGEGKGGEEGSVSKSNTISISSSVVGIG